MIQPANLLKKKLRHRYFPVNLTKFSSFFFSTQVFTDHLRPTKTTSVLHHFLKFWLKKLFEWFSSISETVTANFKVSKSTIAIAISILLSKNVEILPMLLTACSSSKKGCHLSKRPPYYCWYIPKILWKRPVYPDYFFSCDYDKM